MIMKSALDYQPIDIFIKIENTLFNVHKYQLAKSEVFSEMFKLPKPKGGEPEEGSSPECPIVICGTTSSDFAALLKVLYARYDLFLDSVHVSIIMQDLLFFIATSQVINPLLTLLLLFPHSA
jgi:hypothetical protein